MLELLIDVKIIKFLFHILYKKLKITKIIVLQIIKLVNYELIVFSTLQKRNNKYWISIYRKDI